MAEGNDELMLERSGGEPARRPRALWGALAALAVLGGTLAVVAASGGDGSDDPAALPVGLGGSSSARSEGGMSADSSMAAWITYVAGDGLPELGGDAPAYEIVSDVDQDRVRALAAALGFEGEVGLLGDVPDQLSEPWRIEWEAGILEVYGDSLGAWWYSAGAGSGSTGSSGAGWAPHPGGTECVPGPAAECAPVDPEECVPGPAADCGFGSAEGEAVEPTTSLPECAPGDACAEVDATYEKPPVLDDEGVASQECTVTQAADGSTMEECVSHGPAAPADLPSREGAESIALDLLAATGLDVDEARVTVEGPYEAWYVMVEPLLDGVPVSGWISTVGVGSKGAIVSASGTLAFAQRVDDYPLLDTGAAIDRLNAQSAGFGGAEPAPLPAPDEPAATTSLPCKVQPDGREICEHPTTTPFDRGECVQTAQGDGPDQSVSSDCVGMPCPPAPGSDDAPTCVPPIDCGAGAEPGVDPATTVPPGDCGVAPPPILPEPAPLEVVLTGAERVLMLMPAIDGSAESYLVPGYRFTSDEGHVVDVPAVTDDLLAPPQTTPTAVSEPPTPPVTEPGCDTPVGDGSSPSTIAPEGCDGVASSDPEMVHLDDGATPELGVPYYVDVDVECQAFELGGQIWRHVVGDLAGWSLPHEGGRFTLDSPDHGTFVGDSAGTKTATFEIAHAGDGCQPTPRS